MHHLTRFQVGFLFGWAVLGAVSLAFDHGVFAAR